MFVYTFSFLVVGFLPITFEFSLHASWLLTIQAIGDASAYFKAPGPRCFRAAAGLKSALNIRIFCMPFLCPGLFMNAQFEKNVPGFCVCYPALAWLVSSAVSPTSATDRVGRSTMAMTAASPSRASRACSSTAGPV